jgi:hypothetical protein
MNKNTRNNGSQRFRTGGPDSIQHGSSVDRAKNSYGLVKARSFRQEVYIALFHQWYLLCRRALEMAADGSEWDVGFLVRCVEEELDYSRN